MEFLTSPFAAVRVRLCMVWAALVAVPTLLARTVPALLGGEGTTKQRAAKIFAASENQRLIFSVLRLLLPNLVVSAKLVAAYENTGTAIVSRAEDVTEVLDREADFAVVYEPKMRAITGGENFFLGMQDSAEYQRDVSNMRLAVRRTDVSDILVPLAAARADNDALLGAHIFEALRFDPINPVIYRRAVNETTIARSTLRARTIPKGTMVMAANLSAMFDPLRLTDPDAFRTDRPWGHYILWGYGMHTCFGAHINHAIMPQILKPLLKLNGLRRVPGPQGQIDGAGTPFPAHMVLAFDR